MKRRGNMLVITLVACALLAIVLVAGLEVVTLTKATSRNQVASVKLEQLHRTALQDGMHSINESNAPLIAGHVILADTPISGQHRKLSVQAVQPRSVVLCSASRLDDGSARFHTVELLAIPKEARLNFKQSSRALFFGGMEKDVSNRWLSNHQASDIVCLCDGGITIGGGRALKAPLKGSLLLTGWEQVNVGATVQTTLHVKGNVVATGNLSLRHDLSCEQAWIDGKLTIDEGVKLEANKIYLAEDADLDMLKRIEGTIYMPHPPTVEDDGDEEQVGGLDIHVLPENANPKTDRVLYLMLQQLN